MWIEWNPNPVGARVIDCAIRAVAKVLDEDWETAKILIFINGFQMGSVDVDDNVWGSVLRQNGFKRYVIPNTCPDCYTIKDFAHDHPVGRYVVGTGSHAVAVVDGNYYDSWDSGNEIPVFYWYKKEE